MTAKTSEHPRLGNRALYPTRTALEAAFRVARKAKVPQIPDIVLALRREVSSPEPDIRIASDLIAQDLALTGQLLKTINSAAFNQRSKVSSVQQAASLMGLDRLTNLVTAEAIDQALGVQQGPVRVIWESIMEEARAIAAVAQALPMVGEDEAYLFGIMHDVGCLVFATLSVDYVAEWTLHSNAEPRELLSYEKAALGVEHPTVGFLIASNWQLPEHLTLAILHHHAPGHLEVEDPKVSSLIATAKLAHYLIALSHGTNDMPEMRVYREEAWQDLDIGEDDWTTLCGQAKNGGWGQ